MKLLQQTLATILSIGMSYGHLGMIQLVSSQMAIAEDSSKPVAPPAVVDPKPEPAPEPQPEPISAIPAPPIPTTPIVETELPAAPPADLPNPELDKQPASSWAEAAHDGASWSEAAREDYIPPTVSQGDCQDLYLAYGNAQNFCTEHRSGRLPEDVIRRLESCIKLSYQLYVEAEAHRFTAQALQHIETKSKKKGYDAEQVQNRTLRSTQDQLRELNNRLEDFSKVFFGKKGFAYMNEDEQAYFKHIASNVARNPGTSAEHYNQCYHLAQDSARKSWGASNFMAADFHRQTGKQTTCETIFNEGFAMFEDVGGFGVKGTEDRDTARFNAKTLSSRAKAANNGVPYAGNPRGTAVDLAENYGKAIDLANACKVQKPANKKFPWWILLFAPLALLFLDDDDPAPVKPTKKPKPRPPCRNCGGGGGGPRPPIVNPPNPPQPPLTPGVNDLGFGGNRGSDAGSTNAGDLGFGNGRGTTNGSSNPNGLGSGSRDVDTGSNSYGGTRGGDNVSRGLASPSRDGMTKRNIAK